MRLAELKVEGFRSFKTVSWKPGALNVVIGPNGSGKSNLLHFLDFLCASAQGRLGEYVLSKGGFYNFLHDGEAQDISLSLLVPFESNSNVQTYKYSLKLSSFLGFGDPRIENEELAFLEYGSTGKPGSANSLLMRNASSGYFVSHNGQQVPVGGDRGLLPGKTLLSRFAGAISDEQHIALFARYLTGLTTYQHFDTGPDAPVRRPVVTSYQGVLSPNGENLTSFMHTKWTTDRDFKTRIVDAMRAVFGDDFDEIVFPPAGEQLIQLGLRWKSLRQPRLSGDISDGTLRFLYILGILSEDYGTDLIAIDEPETGLHPRMFPVIAEYATEMADRKQIVFTTHSAEFLSAFPEPQSVSATVASLVDGKSDLRVVSGEELQYWLKDYALGEMYRSGQLEGMA